MSRGASKPAPETGTTGLGAVTLPAKEPGGTQSNSVVTGSCITVGANASWPTPYAWRGNCGEQAP